MSAEPLEIPPGGRRLVLNLAWMLGATDLALIVLHLATGLDLVDLDREANLTSWYSSLKLVALALACAAVGAGLPAGRPRRPWLGAAALFLVMSADESAALHESLTRWLLGWPALGALRSTLTGGDEGKAAYAWVWLLLPLVLLAAGFLVRVFARGLRGERGPLLCFYLGLGALLSAVALEAAVLAFPPLAGWRSGEIARYEALTTVEECAELAGVTLLFAAAVAHLVRTARPGALSRAGW